MSAGDNGHVNREWDVAALAPVSALIARARSVVAAPEWPAAAAAALALVAMIEVAARSDRLGINPSITLLLTLCVTTPIAFARTRPVAAAAVVTAGTLLTQFTKNLPTVAGAIALVVLFYLVGRRASRRASLAVALPFIAYAVAPSGGIGAGGRLLAVLLLGLAAVALGSGIAVRRRVEDAASDASRQAIANTLLEHAARGERARIARDLHDVVAHHISMISVQAEAARLTTPGMPAEGARRLSAIADTARTALTEMRRLLGVLRDDAGTPTPRVPQPGLQQLTELIDEARASAGASTRLIVHGRLVPLDPGIELTAYRVVQEALTNARRHAAGAAVDVEIEYAEAAVRIRVRDNGPGPVGEIAAIETGHGLLGMRERVGMVGGTLTVGAAPIGGFLVEAVLPTPATAP
jgi:signal transduction histidine kinase